MLLALALLLLTADQIETVAGSDWVGDGGPATSALLLQAEGIAADLQGNLYVSDAADHRVRKISPAGIITTVTSADSQMRGNWKVVPAKTEPHGITCE